MKTYDALTPASHVATIQTVQETPKNRFSVHRMAGSVPVWKPAETTATSGATSGTSSDTHIGFKDVLDVINPLQHLPLVGTLYRKATGDEISPTSRIIGGTLFGGPIGGILAMADEAVKQQTGSNMGEKALHLVSLDSDKKTDETDTRITWNTPTRTPDDFALNRPRMAGTIPVWNGQASADTRFAAMIDRVSDSENNISYS